MKILLIGNCQAGSFRDALQIWLPEAEIDFLPATRPDTARRAEDIAAAIPDYDHAFIQPIGAARFGPLRRPVLAQAGHANLHFIPGITFGGFHPDCISLGDAEGNLQGPMGTASSALVAAAFAAGLPPARAARLFNSFVYARLGYFQEFALASRAFIAHMEGFGLDGAALLEGWRGRLFMHTVIHPKPYVISDVCHAVLRRLGLAEGDSELGGALGDRLLNHPVWPLYPEIGRRLGLRGHLHFRGPIPTKGDRALGVMDLPAFIARSYEHYATMPERVAQAVAGHSRAAAALALLRAELKLVEAAGEAAA